MKKGLPFLIFNFIGLDVTWAACAYGAINNKPLIGVYVGVAYIILHFIFSKARSQDMLVMLSIGTLGILIDSVLAHLNILSFQNDTLDYVLLPFWLIILWYVFALMLPYSLYWLHKNLNIAAIAGAVVGCFSYWLAHKLGALHLNDPLVISMGIYFILWGIFFPLALSIVSYLTSCNNRIKKTKSAF